MTSADEFRTLLNSVSVGIGIADQSGNLLECNDALLSLSGYDRADFQKMGNVAALYHDLRQRQEVLAAFARQGVVKNHPVQFKRKDGSAFDALLSLTPATFNGQSCVQAVVEDVTQRKQEESASREREHLLSESQRVAHVGGWVWPLTGPITWTAETYRVFGVSPETFVPTVESLVALVHPEDRLAMQRWIEACATGQSPDELEFRAVRSDGTVRLLAGRGEWVADTADTRGHVIGTVHDITERKWGEAALRESEERFRMLFEEGPLGMVIVSMPEGRLADVNATFCEMLGYTKDELKRHSFADDTHPAHRTQDVEAVKRLWGGQIPQYKTEKRYLRKSGDTIWGAETTSLIRSMDGTPRYLLAMIEDITEHKRTEESLRLQSAALHAAADGIIITDRDGTIVWINPAFTSLTGYGAEETIGKNPRELVKSGTHDQTFYAHLWKTILAGDVWRGDMTNRRKDGTLYTERQTVTPVTNDRGELTHFIAIKQDLTAQRHLEAQLQQAQKMESVGRLAGGVAHDFNNMLGVIIGHAEMALESQDPALPLHADLREIRKAAGRSADLTRQLLAFARKQTVMPRVVDLNDTVAGMLSMLRRLIGENVDLQWRPGADLWSIRMDPSQIDQILANLCVNARDAISGIGTLTIETSNSTLDEHYCAGHAGCVPGQYVRLAVSDDGCGMDKDTLAQAFEPFFTTKGIGEGTGLGLATVYGAVKQNNGYINVYSEPNHGTTFTIHLPRHMGKTERAQTDTEPRPTSRGHETILLVEDEPAILTLAQKMLERQGYTVLAARTPGEATRLAAQHPGEIHLLMTDVVMPEMNGRVLAKNLLALNPQLRRLFMSGYTADVIAHHGVLDEGVQFIQKPFTMEALATRVRDALDAPS